MSKFKLRMKLQGLEIEMEGSREDIPKMAHNLGNQLTGLIQPAADVASGQDKRTLAHDETTIDHSPQDIPKTRRSRKKRNATATSPSSQAEDRKIDWAHDSSKFGTPSQSWTTAKKSIWILYVASQTAKVEQMSAPQVSHVFNKKFKQAGLIRPSNVSRDFGKMKLATPALTGEDTTKSISEWFLTESGIKFAQELITDSRGA